MRLEIGPGVRCDLIAYSGRNLSGRRQVLQLFPSGARKGRIDGTQMRSLVIRALLGTRVVLAASDTDNWEQATWRCVRMLEGHSLRSEKRHGLPGIRLPDIDLLDRHGAKKSDPDLQSSYIAADTLANGKGWTFGRLGTLANRVAMIRVHREGDEGHVLSGPEIVAAGMLTALAEAHPDAVSVALQAAVHQLEAVLEGADAPDRIARMQARFTS